MGWLERTKSLFGDGGGLGCFPRIGRKLSKNSYAYPVDPDKRKGSGGPAAEEVVVVDVPEVPLREVNEITGSFSGENLIGQGSYAKVYRATMRSGRAVVVKRLEKPSKHASNVVFLKQLSVASRLKHDNFARLLGYTISGDLRVLVYEFATMGTLHDVLHGDRVEPAREAENPRPVLSWAHRVNIALDAARGLEYLHETVRPAVTHKDVRSTNVLLFEGYRAKIADYNMFSQAADMARLNRSTHTLGSFGYQAPEYAVRDDGPDDRQERRVQLRNCSSRALDGEEAVGPDAAAGPTEPGELGNSNADGRQSSGMHRPKTWRSVSSSRCSQARKNRGAVPAVRPRLPAKHGHCRPRDPLRRGARPAGRGLISSNEANPPRDVTFCRCAQSPVAVSQIRSVYL